MSTQINSMLSTLDRFVITIPEEAATVEEFSTALHSMNAYDFETVSFYETLLRGEIPKEIPFASSRDHYFNFSNGFSGITFHSYGQKLGYYGRATKGLAIGIKDLVGDEVVLDPMAGVGHMALALREADVRTIATDNHSWNISSPFENIDAIDSLKKYGHEISYLLLSWPPYQSKVDVELVKLLRSDFPHVQLMYIGEGEGGCTGSEEFWSIIGEESHQDSVYYETTYGLHDNFYLFEKP